MSLGILNATVLTIILLSSANAVATNNIVCGGDIKRLGIHSTNGVYLQLSSMNTVVKICDLGQTVGSVNPVGAEQCKAIYSTLLSAYTMGKGLAPIYFDNVEIGNTCTNFRDWELATARWVELVG